MIIWPQREFPYGSMGVPRNGLLVGGGGGWTLRYTDYVLHADGKIERLEYKTEGGPIPDGYRTTGTGAGDPETIRDFDEKLLANGFWSLELEPATSNELVYVVAANEKKGAHDAVWTPDALDEPDKIASIRNDILKYAMGIVGC